jgi:hypothetical protein
MRTIILTYPGFQSLPKGIKQMLVTSENLFFGNAGNIVANKKSAGPNDAKIPEPNIFMQSPAAGCGPAFRLQTVEKPIAFNHELQSLI